jgi:Flp pilus assembly protein TadD
MHLPRFVKQLLCMLLLVPAAALAGHKPAKGHKDAKPAQSQDSKPAQDKDSKSAKALLEEGSKYMKARRFPQALNALRRCTSVDPKLADCHLKLGAVYGSTGEYDLGAQQYREFLKLAPNSPMAPKVRGILADYEKEKHGVRR